jgi:ketosteroid isomerase-like protein
MNSCKLVLLAAALLVFLADGFSRATPALARLQEPGEPTVGVNTQSGKITAKEHEILDDLKKGDLQAFAALTADDALSVDSTGPKTKVQRPKNTGDYQLMTYSMENVRFIEVGPDTGLITYKISKAGTAHGKPFSTKSYVSSLWITRGGNWVRLFTQETPAG